MQYRILKKENQIEIRGFMRSISQTLRSCDAVLPFTTSGDGIDFQIPDAETLQEHIRYISEIQYLLCVYSIAKAAELVERESKGLLQFVLDTQYIFCREGTICGILAPLESGESVDYKSFFWNLLFIAGFETKEIPIIQELLGFIRAARTIHPQDLILFIEMGVSGKEIAGLYAGQHSSAPTSPSQETSSAQEDAQDLPLQSGNDFSSFLSDFDQPMEYDEEDLSEQQPAQIAFTPQDGASDFLLDAADDVQEDQTLPDSSASDQSREISAQHDAETPKRIQPASEPEPEYVDEAPVPQEESDGELDELLDESIPSSPAKLPDETVHDAPRKSAKQSVKADDTPNEKAEIPSAQPPKKEIPSAPPRRSTSPEPQPAAPKPAPSQVRRFVQPVEQTPPAEPAPMRQFAVPVRAPRPDDRPAQNGGEHRYYLISSEGRSCPILKSPFTIGRAVQGVDLTVQDMYVSRVHAQIIRDGNGIYFVDLHPRNPSFLNERPAEADRPYPLHDEDRIRFGKTTYYFRCVSTKR